MNNDGNYGVAGVAWDADVAGFRMGYGSAGSNAQILDVMQRQKAMDVSNNSWGFGGFFSDNFATTAFAGIGNAATFKQMPMIFERRQAGGVIGWTSAIAAYAPEAVWG